MFEKETSGSFSKKMLRRIAKAIIKGVFYLAILYALPMFLASQVSEFAPDLFGGYTELLVVFAALVIFFVVAAELTAGTIFHHGFNIGKAIFVLIFFVVTLNRAVVDMTVNLEGTSMGFWADLRIFFFMFIVIDLLALARSTLRAVGFLSQRAEQQLPTLKPTE